MRLENFPNLEVVLHLPPDNIGVVNNHHLLAGADQPVGGRLARLVCLLQLVWVEVVVA
jgi:hypothetical protein